MADSGGEKRWSQKEARGELGLLMGRKKIEGSSLPPPPSSARKKLSPQKKKFVVEEGRRAGPMITLKVDQRGKKKKTGSTKGKDARKQILSNKLK